MPRKPSKQRLLSALAQIKCGGVLACWGAGWPGPRRHQVGPLRCLGITPEPQRSKRHQCALVPTGPVAQPKLLSLAPNIVHCARSKEKPSGFSIVSPDPRATLRCAMSISVQGSLSKMSIFPAMGQSRIRLCLLLQLDNPFGLLSLVGPLLPIRRHAGQGSSVLRSADRTSKRKEVLGLATIRVGITHNEPNSWVSQRTNTAASEGFQLRNQ
jgi:hypothetical protein